MDDSDDRIAELVAAAVAGELTSDEAAELDELRRMHPWIDDEIASMRELTRRVEESGSSWTSPQPDSALRDRITSGLTDLPSHAPAVSGQAEPRRRLTAVGSGRQSGRRPRRWLVPLLGAACLAIGVGVGLAVPPLVTGPPSGPPGTLGAIEEIDVRDEVAGAEIDADLVAHTWGTETILEATGLEVGATYSVVLIGSDGTEFSAGEMLGSTVPIHCRLNAAVLRQDAVRLEIREANGDAVAAAADLPLI